MAQGTKDAAFVTAAAGVAAVARVPPGNFHMLGVRPKKKSPVQGLQQWFSTRGDFVPGRGTVGNI